MKSQFFKYFFFPTKKARWQILARRRATADHCPLFCRNWPIRHIYLRTHSPGTGILFAVVKTTENRPLKCGFLSFFGSMWSIFFATSRTMPRLKYAFFSLAIYLFSCFCQLCSTNKTIDCRMWFL